MVKTYGQIRVPNILRQEKSATLNVEEAHYVLSKARKALIFIIFTLYSIISSCVLGFSDVNMDKRFFSTRVLV